MKPLFLFIAACLLSACVALPAKELVDVAVKNENFVIADTEKPSLPAHWRTDGQFVELKLDSGRKRASTPSVRVQFKEGAPYAGIVQRAEIEKVRGKRIVLRTYIDRVGDDAEVGVWVRAFDQSGKSIAYENTYETKQLPTGQWTLHQLSINVPAETNAVLVGASIYGKDGTMWVDAMELRTQPS